MLVIVFWWLWWENRSTLRDDDQQNSANSSSHQSRRHIRVQRVVEAKQGAELDSSSHERITDDEGNFHGGCGKRDYSGIVIQDENETDAQLLLAI